MKSENKKTNDEFELYDLKVEVVEGKNKFVCSHNEGDCFELQGENISIQNGKKFSIYALAAILPLLPAKQRFTHKNDWMTTDTEVACPDPNCGAILKITRTGKRKFRHSDVTDVPLRGKNG